MTAKAKEELPPRPSSAERGGPHFFLQKTYLLSTGKGTGMTFHLRGGTPEKNCHGTSFLGSPAAILGFPHRVSAGSDTVDHFSVFLAAAAPLPERGQPSGDGKLTLALTSAPNDGCCA